MTTLQDVSMSSTPARGDAQPGAVAGAAPGSEELPRDLRGLDAAYPTAPGAGAAGAPGSPAAAPPARDALFERLFGRGAALPFDVVALRTGKAAWEIPDEDRDLLRDEASNVARHFGVGVDRQAHPLVRLGLAYVAVGIGPVMVTLLDRVEALQKRVDHLDPAAKPPAVEIPRPPRNDDK